MLDQSPIAQGSTGTQALERTLELARLADGLGYHRFWVAEHHGTPMLAGAAPEAVIGPIAATTARIRVGSGGVMLHHYSPRKVAETFSVLGGMFRGRIDVGIGRGADADPVTTHALQRDRRVPDPQDYADQLAELVAYLDDRPPPDRRFAGLASLPGLLPEPCPCEDLEIRKLPPKEEPASRYLVVARHHYLLAGRPVGQHVQLLPGRSNDAPGAADPVVDNELFKGAEEQQHLVGHALDGVPDGAEPPLFVQRRVGTEIVTEWNPNDGLKAALGEILHVRRESVDPHRELQDGNKRKFVPVRLTDVICR